MTALVAIHGVLSKHDLRPHVLDKDLAPSASLPQTILGARDESLPRPDLTSRKVIKVDEILLQNAEKLIEDSIKKLGGDIGSAIDLIVYNDKNNGSSRISKEKVDFLKTKFSKIKESGLIGDPKKIGYNEVIKINDILIKELIEAGQNPLEFSFIGNADHVTLDNFCEHFLSDLKSGDSIRILEPGNNDQTTPIVLSSQIKKIKEYCSSRELTNISIEVLVMGKGGHATTALFPQIGTIETIPETKNTIFSGVEEAVSLSETLSDALTQNKINHKFIEMTEPFTKDPDSSFTVQIKLEKGSTNTGENVRASKAAWKESNESTKYFIAAATTANGRQLATFAHQIGINYDEMISLPMLRSKTFIENAFDTHAAITEMYAGLAERCRNFLYMYMQNPQGENFIPLSLADTHNLENLYEIYANLSGMSFEDAKGKSLQDLQTWFGTQFSTMEKSIDLNTKLNGHLSITRSVVKTITERVKKL